MDIDFSQFMGMYIDGSKENLDMMDKRLLELEQNPSSQEAIGEIFRTAHTLKGMSATMGFEKVAHLTHEMESILDELRNHVIPVTPAIVDLLFETFDVLRILVNDSISSTDSGVDLQTITEKLQRAAALGGSGETNSQNADSGTSTPPSGETEEADESGLLEDLQDIILNEFELQVLLQAEQSGLSLYLLKVVLSPNCLLKAPRAFMVTRTLEELRCDIIKAIPDTKDLEEEKFDLSFKMLLISPATREEVKSAVAAISEIDKVVVRIVSPTCFPSIESCEPARAPQQPKVVEPVHVPAAPAAAASSRERPSASPPTPQSIAPPPPRPRPSVMEAPLSAKPSAPASSPSVAFSPPVPVSSPEHSDLLHSAASKQPGGKSPTVAERRGSQTIRVDMRRLDELMNLVGELVINRTRLQDIGAAHKLKDLNETLARVNQISTSLQNVVMQVRMVPIEQVFERFPRMVRDLAKKLNKKINIILEGKETEMDRTVIDEIGDPMVHLIRNAIDHGIELPAQRVAVGKPETGTIHLIARHEGNSVIIEVRDDGKGVDPSIIARLAVSRGLFTQEQIDKMPPEEIIKIIFMAGFSTSETVSDISGRGVGMDAVKAKLEELNGILDVESRVGEGTRIIIKLPLTLAILPALMVKLASETFAIPLGSVQETMDISQQEINIVQHQEVTLLRGDVLPILRLRQLLDVPKPENEVEKTEELSIVVCSSGEKRGGFLVDELLGQQEIVIKSLGNLLGGLSGIMGATMRGDGSIALILDIPSFLTSKSGNIGK